MADILSILSPIQSDIERVDALIADRLESNLEVISDLNRYISKEGKRVRPALVLLSALSCSYRGDDHIKVAAVVEFIHTATLLHDDVVDDASERRSKPSAPKVWGNGISVLTGDFLYSRAFEMLCEIGNLELIDVMSTTTNIIAEGEVQQLINIGKTQLSEDEYITIAERKTAKLFETACRMGGVLAGAEDAIQQELAHFGRHLGLAFQLVDDILDYTDNTGKQKGQDLREGKLTLPIVHAMQHGDPTDRQALESALGSDRSTEVIAICERLGSFQYTHDKACAYINTATQSLDKLSQTTYRETFHELLQFLLERKY